MIKRIFIILAFFNALLTLAQVDSTAKRNVRVQFQLMGLKGGFNANHLHSNFDYMARFKHTAWGLDLVGMKVHIKNAFFIGAGAGFVTTPSQTKGFESVVLTENPNKAIYFGYLKDRSAPSGLPYLFAKLGLGYSKFYKPLRALEFSAYYTSGNFNAPKISFSLKENTSNRISTMSYGGSQRYVHGFELCAGHVFYMPISEDGLLGISSFEVRFAYTYAHINLSGLEYKEEFGQGKSQTEYTLTGNMNSFTVSFILGISGRIYRD